jgi:hypothetical protein
MVGNTNWGDGNVDMPVDQPKTKTEAEAKEATPDSKPVVTDPILKNAGVGFPMTREEKLAADIEFK